MLLNEIFNGSTFWTTGGEHDDVAIFDADRWGQFFAKRLDGTYHADFDKDKDRPIITDISPDKERLVINSITASGFVLGPSTPADYNNRTEIKFTSTGSDDLLYYLPSQGVIYYGLTRWQ